ncbi:hypothetical protein NHJ13734_006463 [Beauveria thailandica]
MLRIGQSNNRRFEEVNARPDNDTADLHRFRGAANILMSPTILVTSDSACTFQAASPVAVPFRSPAHHPQVQPIGASAPMLAVEIDTAPRVVPKRQGSSVAWHAKAIRTVLILQNFLGAKNACIKEYWRNSQNGQAQVISEAYGPKEGMYCPPSTYKLMTNYALIDLSAAVDVSEEAVAKEDGAHASYTGTARAPPARRNQDPDEATSDRDESHRYGGDSIVADDEDD